MFRGHVHHSQLTLDQLKARRAHVLREYRAHLGAKYFDPAKSERLHAMLLRYDRLIEARAKQ